MYWIRYSLCSFRGTAQYVVAAASIRRSMPALTFYPKGVSERDVCEMARWVKTALADPLINASPSPPSGDHVPSSSPCLLMVHDPLSQEASGMPRCQGFRLSLNVEMIWQYALGDSCGMKVYAAAAPQTTMSSGVLPTELDGSGAGGSGASYGTEPSEGGVAPMAPLLRERQTVGGAVRKAGSADTAVEVIDRPTGLSHHLSCCCDVV